MTARTILLNAAVALTLAAPAGAVVAQEMSKDALVNDPKVRQSLEPGNTPLGRNPPNQHKAETDPELQKAIDEAQKGGPGKEGNATATGRASSEGTVSTDPAQGRQPQGQQTETKDGAADRPVEKPPQ